MISLFCDLVLLFSIYIFGIKFLIWMRYWSCFQHSNINGYCALYILYYKLLWLSGFGFMLIFFLNLGFFYIAVAYRHKYPNTQHISKRKKPLLYSIYQVYSTNFNEGPAGEV